MGSFLRVATALIPLALMPVWVQLIGSGRLDLGGGEKGLGWVLPWFLWSWIFGLLAPEFVHSLAVRLLLPSIVRFAMVGFAGVLLVALLLAAFGQLEWSVASSSTLQEATLTQDWDDCWD